jgi:aspartate aminotransferase-like enzyme
VPQYLDVAETIHTEGPRFTFSSPLLFALEQALAMQYDYSRLGCLVREYLRKAGVTPLVAESLAATTVTTFAPPGPSFLERSRAIGYALGGDSDYLATRNLVQIATMGAITPQHIKDFFAHWESLSAKASAA